MWKDSTAVSHKACAWAGLLRSWRKLVGLLSAPRAPLFLGAFQALNGRSGSFYTTPNAPNVRTLNGHIDIPLAKYPSRGHVAREAFGIVRDRESVPNVFQALWPPQLMVIGVSCHVFTPRSVPH